MKWFYEIRGNDNLLKDRSDAIYESAELALAAGGDKAAKLVNSTGGPGGGEVLTIMTGRK